MTSLNLITSAILKSYSHSVIEKLICDIIRDENHEESQVTLTSKDETKLATDNVSVSLANETQPPLQANRSLCFSQVKSEATVEPLISLGTSFEETLTPNFIKTCPLIKDVRSSSLKNATSSNLSRRRGGVSERNELDRYIFKVVLKNYLCEVHLDNMCLL